MRFIQFLSLVKVGQTTHHPFCVSLCGFRRWGMMVLLRGPSELFGISATAFGRKCHSLTVPPLSACFLGPGTHLNPCAFPCNTYQTHIKVSAMFLQKPEKQKGDFFGEVKFAESALAVGSGKDSLHTENELTQAKLSGRRNSFVSRPWRMKRVL